VIWDRIGLTTYRVSIYSAAPKNISAKATLVCPLKLSSNDGHSGAETETSKETRLWAAIEMTLKESLGLSQKQALK
jgi:hypothetical protein